MNKNILIYALSLLKSNKEVIKNCGLEIINTLLKNNYPIKNKTKYAKIAHNILKISKLEDSIKKASITIGLTNYKPSYPILIKHVQDKTALYDEVIITTALLGDKYKNEYIKNTLIKLNAEVKDKRLTRSVKKALYIMNNNNKYIKLFDNVLMNKLADIGSNNYNASYKAETYFKHYNEENPNKIKNIKENRVKVLKLALKDINPKIQFKAVKLLGEIGSNNNCKPLKNYYQNLNKANTLITYQKNLKRISLISLAKLKCSNILPELIINYYSKKSMKPLLIFLKNNPNAIESNKKFFNKNPLILSQREAFPKNKQQINYLINHPNKLIRTNAIYSLFKSKYEAKVPLLKIRLKKERDPHIKELIQSIIKIINDTSPNK